jgi:hypothetical protein
VNTIRNSIGAIYNIASTTNPLNNREATTLHLNWRVKAAVLKIGGLPSQDGNFSSPVGSTHLEVRQRFT